MCGLVTYSEKLWKNVFLRWHGFLCDWNSYLVTVCHSSPGNCLVYGPRTGKDQHKAICRWGNICSTARECQRMRCFSTAAHLSSSKWESHGTSDNDWCLSESISQEHHCCDPVLWICQSRSKGKFYGLVYIKSNISNHYQEFSQKLGHVN